MTTAASTAPDPDLTGAGAEWTVDQLARLADVPVRTIREYQTIGLLPRPRKQGRVGRYRRTHLDRLGRTRRLQRRGYSLAGIGDLLARWRDGANLEEVLQLEPDQLVHVDEPGAPVTIDQLVQLVPALVPDRFDELLATGVVDACGPDRFCIPSPSLLQLAVDALAVGLGADDVLELLRSIRAAADAVADDTVRSLDRIPADADPAAIAAFVQRGRGLLAHGVGRLTLHRVGGRLGVAGETDVDGVVDRLAHARSERP